MTTKDPAPIAEHALVGLQTNPLVRGWNLTLAQATLAD